MTPAKKRKPRPLPTKKEIAEKGRAALAESSWGRGVLKEMHDDPASSAFVRPMGVPCVDPQWVALDVTASTSGTATIGFTEIVETLPSPGPQSRDAWGDDWYQTRYRMAERLFWLARTLRRLAWRIAP